MIILIVLVFLQIGARQMNISIPGLTAYSGYVMGSGFFFALAYTAHNNGHIKVSLLQDNLGKYRQLVMIFATGVSAIITTFLAISTFLYSYESYLTGELSQGQDAMLLWVPQLTMTIGTSVFAIAIWDLFMMTFEMEANNEEVNRLTKEGTV
jgi:TRAP-type mannitol/chloroaromatic compound transport system permease small subunit